MSSLIMGGPNKPKSFLGWLASTVVPGLIGGAIVVGGIAFTKAPSEPQQEKAPIATARSSNNGGRPGQDPGSVVEKIATEAQFKKLSDDLAAMQNQLGQLNGQLAKANAKNACLLEADLSVTVALKFMLDRAQVHNDGAASFWVIDMSQHPQLATNAIAAVDKCRQL